MLPSFRGIFSFLLVSIPFLATQIVSGEEAPYLPVVLWHGIGDTCCSHLMEGTASSARDLIEAAMPAVYVKSLSIGDTMVQDFRNAFFMHPNKQIELACQQIRADPQLASGYNAVGFSQGGLFLRAVAERCPTPPMQTLITLGTPHQGVFGMPKCPTANWISCRVVRRFLNFAAYQSLSQKDIVPASYWHDSKDELNYRATSTFLAEINNENETHPEYAKNLQKLKRFIMIKFNNDSIIEPIASQWFEFYAPGQDKNIIPLNESELYQKDKLGLRHMATMGQLVFIETNDDHLFYTKSWFIKNVIVYLK